MEPEEKKTAIFIMPRSSSDWAGAEALWITVAGWAAAAKRRFGRSIVLTSDRIAKPEEVYAYPLFKVKARKNRNGIAFIIPSFLRIFLGDLLHWRRSKNWRILEKVDLESEEVAFVWENHDLFAGPGRHLADKLQVPLIKYVHAPVIWEASQWGVRRPVWGKILQQMEVKALNESDHIAVVSEKVKRVLQDIGVESSKIFISPMGVDPEFFMQRKNGFEGLRSKLHLQNCFVIGWTGSFRKFHGLPSLIIAFERMVKKYPHFRLLLVGEGPEKLRIFTLVEDLKLTKYVLFLGKKRFREIPGILSIFDLAVVNGEANKDFHYSPLKLREYLIAGLPVLAPAAGEIKRKFEDKKHLLFFSHGDVDDFSKRIEELYLDHALRAKISIEGKKFILENSTWDVHLNYALRRISS